MQIDKIMSQYSKGNVKMSRSFNYFSVYLYVFLSKIRIPKEEIIVKNNKAILLNKCVCIIQNNNLN